MSQPLDLDRISQLKMDALDNIESYDDPDSPGALAKYTQQMKQLLQDDPDLLDQLPEYLPVALYGRVQFPPSAKKLWAGWLRNQDKPNWDQFKTAIAFNNSDLALVKAVRAKSEDLLIEACAVLFLLDDETIMPVSRSAHDQDDDNGDQDDDNERELLYDADDYSAAQREDDEADEDEDGYDDAFDDIKFSREER